MTAINERAIWRAGRPAVLTKVNNSLKWSINAADEQQFEKIMGVSGKLFHTALGNVESAWEVRKRGGHKTGLYASSIKYDGEQLVKMDTLLNEHVRPYVDHHYWLPLYSMGAFATQRERELGYRPTAGNQGRIGALRDAHLRKDVRGTVCENCIAY